GSRMFVFPRGQLHRIEIVPDRRYGGQEFHDRHFYPRSLRFSQGFSLPAEPEQYRLTARQRQRWNWEDLLYFKDMFHARFAQGSHQFFGQPPYLKPPRSYQLVANIGEVYDRYYFFVPSGRVELLDFARLRVVYQCS